MKFFNKSQTETSVATSEDIRAARDYVDAIHMELRQSTEQQELAKKQLSSLTKSIEKMELGLSATARLQSETKRLTQENAKLQQDAEKKSVWASELESKLNHLERQHSEARAKLETARKDVAVQQDLDAAQKNELQDLKRDAVTLAARLEERDAKILSLKNANERLQEDLHSYSIDVSKSKRDVLELQKSNEILVSKLETHAKNSDLNQVELKTQRVEHDDLKSRYFEAMTTLENMRYNAKAQKTIFEETLKRRDDENLALKTQIDQANTQVRIKDNMSTHLDQEISGLRNNLEIDRERLAVTEQRYREKANEADINAQALERARREYETLNEKFSTALEDIETLRRTTLAQQEKLDRYAAVNGAYEGLDASDAEHFTNTGSNPGVKTYRALKTG